jgi:nucleoside permease NupC
MWAGLFAAVAIFVLGASMTGTGGFSRVAWIGMAFWLPLLIASIKSPVLTKPFVSVTGALIIALNALFLVFGPMAPATSLSLQLILGWLHWPIAFAMGTPLQDCLVVGRMLGEKLILTEFVAYADLAGYLQASSQGTVTPLDPRSVVIVSYALSGFANFVSIAIQIGGISPLAPSRRSEIARLGFRAMIGGAITSYIVACVAGTFYSGVSMLGL